MPHSHREEPSSISLRSDSLQPKNFTYTFPLQLPEKWLINQPTTKKLPLRNYDNNNNNETIQDHDSSLLKPCLRSWVAPLLRECGNAICEANSGKTHQLLWLLNELASAYGDLDQRLAYCFLLALLAKFKPTLKCVYLEKKNYYCFNTNIRLNLKFQEVSPWTTFGHVASNGVILEALENDENNKNLHVIDLGNTSLCTQWPTLLEALATRFDETPSLRLTLVVTSALERNLVEEVSKRMEKFARLMGVPFKLHMIMIDGLDFLEELKREDFSMQDGEVIVVNCIQALQRVQVEKRVVVLDKIRSIINPKIITIVEEEANLSTTRNDFGKSFEECLRFYRLYFEMLQDSFDLPTSNDRYRLERERSSNLVRVLASDHDSDQTGEAYWMPDTGNEWTKMLKKHEFHPFRFSDEVVGDVKALLRRYKGGWELLELQKDNNNNNEVGVHLTWRGEPVVWASAWKSNNVS